MGKSTRDTTQNMKTHQTLDKFLTDEMKARAFRALGKAGEARRKVVSALIGERIKRKLTQAELAQKAGLKQPSLARVENGHVNPSLAMLSKLARALNMRLDIHFSPL